MALETNGIPCGTRAGSLRSRTPRRRPPPYCTFIKPTHAQLQRECARLAADLLDHVARQAVGRERTGRIAGVDAGLLDVLHDAGDHRGLAVADGVDVYLDGIRPESGRSVPGAPGLTVTASRM